MKILIYICMSIMALGTANAQVQKESVQTLFTNYVAISSQVRIGQTTIVNNKFNTNEFPVSLVLANTDGMVVPGGTTAQRPTSYLAGYPILRYNTDVQGFEYNFNNTGWAPLVEYIDEYTVTYGNNNDTIAGTIYVLNNGNWTKACATNLNTVDGLLGVAKGTNSSEGIIIRGVVSIDGLTVGTQYISTNNNGTCTSISPSNVATYCRIVGYAISTTNMVLSPSETYLGF